MNMAVDFGDLRSRETAQSGDRRRTLGARTALTERGYRGEEGTQKHAFCETNPIVMLSKLHLYGLWRTGWIDCRKMTIGFVFSGREEKPRSAPTERHGCRAHRARLQQKAGPSALRGRGPRLTTAATADRGRYDALPKRSFDKSRNPAGSRCTTGLRMKE